MELQWTKIDPKTATKEEIQAEIERMKNLRNSYMNAEQAIKIFINSVYGATGSPWFAFFNTSVAEAVTLQGQDLIKYSEKVIDRYFLEFWHKDTKLHKILGLTRVEKIEKSTILYCDTDSVQKDTIIITDKGEMSIEDLFNISKKIGEEWFSNRKEYTTSPFKTLNEKKGELIYSPIKKVIRHKVTKAKWKLKTKSGKEIIVTNDHSLIINRNGKNVEVKPENVKNGEKVICVRIN
jgi:DNA polymerase elongation subunit (family B)